MVYGGRCCTCSSATARGQQGTFRSPCPVLCLHNSSLADRVRWTLLCICTWFCKRLLAMRGAGSFQLTCFSASAAFRRVQWTLIIDLMAMIGFRRTMQSIKNHWYSFLEKRAAKRQVDLAAFVVPEAVLVEGDVRVQESDDRRMKRARKADVEDGDARRAEPAERKEGEDEKPPRPKSTKAAAEAVEPPRKAASGASQPSKASAKAAPAADAPRPASSPAARQGVSGGAGSGGANAASKASGPVYASIEWRRLGELEIPSNAAFALHLHGGMLRFLDAAGSTITDRPVSRVKLGQELAVEGVPAHGWTVYPDGRLVAHDSTWPWEG